MTKTLPIFAAVALLPACATVQGAATDVRTVGETAVQMVKDIPDLELPLLPEIDATPFDEMTDEVRAYCDAVDARWKAGKEQVELGEDLLEEGQSRMKDGQQAVREGKRRIATGELMLVEARRELGLKTGRAKPEARDMARLSDPEMNKAIRVKMEQGLRRMEAGGDQVEFGASEIDIAQKRLAEAIQRLKQGHALMSEDEGRCREIKSGS